MITRCVQLYTHALRRADNRAGSEKITKPWVSQALCMRKVVAAARNELQLDDDRFEVGPLSKLIREWSMCSFMTTVLRSVPSFLTQSVPWDEGWLQVYLTQGVP